MAAAAPIGVVLVALLSVFYAKWRPELPDRSSVCRFPPIYNFGDSNSDTGSVSALISREVPYPNGRNFVELSRRYSLGRLIIDFMGDNFWLVALDPPVLLTQIFTSFSFYYAVGIAKLECVSRFNQDEFPTQIKFCSHWVHDSATSSQNIGPTLFPSLALLSYTLIKIKVLTILFSHTPPSRRLTNPYIILHLCSVLTSMVSGFPVVNLDIRRTLPRPRTSQRLSTLWTPDKTIREKHNQTPTFIYHIRKR